jgi:hypothetical protein
VSPKKETWAALAFFALLGMFSWIVLVPYSFLSDQSWGIVFSLSSFIALLMTILVSSIAIVNSYWLRLAPRLRFLRLISVGGGMLGTLGILWWISWVFAPLCFSTMPIAPGICPPVPNTYEAWSLLVGLVVLLGDSLFLAQKLLRMMAH